MKSGQAIYKTQEEDASKPADKFIQDLLYKREDALSRSILEKYKCNPQGRTPETRAQSLIQTFNLPRTAEERRFQSMCWAEAEETAKALKGKDDILAQNLKLSLTANRDAINIQQAIESCHGPSSASRTELLKLLQTAAPLDLFRTVPANSTAQLRDAIYSESLALSVDRSIELAKAHGLNYSNIVDRVCPTGSPCANDSHQRNLKTFLQSEYEQKKTESIPRENDSTVFNSLQGNVSRIDSAGKTFNSQLDCREVGTFLTGSNLLCNAKNSDDGPKSQNSNFYSTVDDIYSSNDGALLAHEPFKNDLKTIYSGIPVNWNGETSYVFFDKHNNPPGQDALNDKTAWTPLPDNLRILGGAQSVHEAAVNTFQDTIKYATELNKIEDSLRKGKDPDQFIFGTGDPSLKGLALMARLNPEGTARVLLSNPQLAKTDIPCQMISAGQDLEREKEIEGKIQKVASLGSLALFVPRSPAPWSFEFGRKCCFKCQKYS